MSEAHARIGHALVCALMHQGGELALHNALTEGGYPDLAEEALVAFRLASDHGDTAECIGITAAIITAAWPGVNLCKR